jgi:uncharacterized Zn finger protein
MYGRRKSKSRYESFWAPYVTVGERRAQAEVAMEKRRKKGLPVDPVVVTAKGRSAIAGTFWGKAWCDGLESQADLFNRLERGRTYARNGSVVHLAVQSGLVEAIVSGSSLYEVSVKVKPLDESRWRRIRAACGDQVESSLALLQGKLAPAVMSVLTHPDDGMVPRRGELTMRCSCPDGVSMCKHVAAVLYGVGARLDTRPELLFTLRGVALQELVSAAGKAVAAPRKVDNALVASADDLGALFGIDLDDGAAPAPPPPTAPRATKPRAKRIETAAAKLPPAPAKKAPAPAMKAAAPAKKAAAPAMKAPAPAPTGVIGVLLAGAEVTLDQLRRRGHTASQLKALQADGTLVRFDYGWYRLTRPL